MVVVVVGGAITKSTVSEFVIAGAMYEKCIAGRLPTGKSGYIFNEMPQAQSIISLVLMEDIFFQTTLIIILHALQLE